MLRPDTDIKVKDKTTSGEAVKFKHVMVDDNVNPNFAPIVINAESSLDDLDVTNVTFSRTEPEYNYSNLDKELVFGERYAFKAELSLAHSVESTVMDRGTSVQ